MNTRSSPSEKLPEIWGVAEPHQIIDLFGLMGDASDNIPGIPGIGPKTAQKLIAEFGSIENLIANAAKLKGKQKENVETHSDQALLSKDLATIITDVPVDVTWDDLVLSPRDDEAVKTSSTNSNSAPSPSACSAHWQRGIHPPDSSSPATPPTLFETFKTIRDVDHTYHLADTPEIQKQLFAGVANKTSFCFDIETTSLDRFSAKLLGIAFSWKPTKPGISPIPNPSSPISNPSSPHPPKKSATTSNTTSRSSTTASRSRTVLRHHARRHAHRPRAPALDGLPIEILLGYTPVKLSDIAATPQEAAPAEDDLFAFAEKSRPPRTSTSPPSRSKPSPNTPPRTRTSPGNSPGNCARCWRRPAGGYPDEIEGPLLPVLVRMEMEGIAIDPPRSKSIGVELQQQIDELAKSIHHHAGRPFNIASPKQLGEILFDSTRPRGQGEENQDRPIQDRRTDARHARRQTPDHRDILAWREATKLKSTYLDALPNHIVPETGRIHTHFHQLVAATGRLASSDPNLQNIPVSSEAGRKIRKAFVPRDLLPKVQSPISCSPATTRRSSCASWPPRQRRHHDRGLPQPRRHPHHHRRQGLSSSSPTTSPPTCAAPRRW
jgi:DNA polymerase I